MSFPPSWNDGTAAPGNGNPGPQAPPPPYDPSGGMPPYPGPSAPAGAAAPPPYGPQAAPPGAPADGTAGQGGTDRHQVAGWGKRALARAVDNLVIGIPVSLVALFVSLAWGGAKWLLASGSDIADSISIIFGLVGFLLFVVYETVCVRRWRRTFGKYVAGLEVAPLSGAGHQGPIPVASMIARAALLNLPVLAGGSAGWAFALFLLLALPCWLWPLWDRPNSQGLQDKIAGTVVLRSD